MHSPGTNSGTKGLLNISDAGPRFGSTKLAAGAPHIRAFWECVGMWVIRGALTLAVLSALLIIAARPAQAQTEAVLYSFTGGSDGGDPQSCLTFDAAGNLYGTTHGGGAFGQGTVFELSPNGNGGWNETVLYSFTGGADGANPIGPAMFDSVGNLYGTAPGGGVYGYGVVFELSPVGASWTETVLYNFAGGTDGANPATGLIFDPAGNLYGTTAAGTVFEMSPSGGGWTERVIYYADNAIRAGLTMDAAGNIFGASYWTVFELSPNGNGGWNPSVLHTFGAHKDGFLAYGTPVFDQAGELYVFGTTWRGGQKDYGTVYFLFGEENDWGYYVLYSFGKSGKIDGRYPWGGIVMDGARNTYGTTMYGGKSDNGAVFELAPPYDPHSHKVLWNFNYTDGYAPESSLILDSAGRLYGTTTGGGSSNAGVVFEVNPSPAVTTTTLTSSPNPSTHGQAVTFTAVVTSSAGAPPDGEAVSFMKGKTVLGTGALSGGSASFTTSTLPVGGNLITAVYGGDLYFLGSKSNMVRQLVEKAGK